MTRTGLRGMGLAWRMSLLVLAGTGSVLAAMVGYSVYHARQMLETEMQQKAFYLAQATANRIETVEYSVEKVTEGMALAFEDGSHASREGLYHVLEKLIRTTPEISGAAVAFAPRGDGLPMDVPYVYREQGQVRRKNLGGQGSHYQTWDWYTVPAARLKPVWTPPYFDQGGANMLMVTYAVPFFSLDGRFNGIVTCDVALEWLRDYLASLPLGETGYATLLAGDGTFLAHPNRELVMQANLLTTADKRQNPTLRHLGERMLKGETGIASINNLMTGQPSWLAFAPIPSPGWSLGVIFPQDEALAPMARFTREGILIGLGGFSLLLVVVLGIARSITQPLRRLDHAVRHLSESVGASSEPPMEQNGFTTESTGWQLPIVQGQDEVARLAASFGRMQQDLDRHIKDLQAATAERERFESELRVARDIQRSLIPKAMAASDAFEVHGLLEPTRDVGGDFYDFFMADSEHLCLAIGDVSGKGVPAALFMAVTRTLLKASFQANDPADTLTRVNDALAAENDSTMFVSLFVAVIHLPSGNCRYANGGHNPPVLLRAGGTKFLPKVQGALVGAMPGIPFGLGHCQLEKGDRFFLYTDGVTEALNVDQALFGETRMLDTLKRTTDDSCAGMLNAMREAIRTFVGDAEQSDDITMLAFRY